jgi:4-hydroxythreonine-4-phosphate dehydrogenase
LTSKPIFISLGDPSGIGPEVFVKSLSNPEIQKKLSCFVVVASQTVLQETIKKLGKNYKINPVSDQFNLVSDSINVLHVDGCVEYELGFPQKDNAKYILKCLSKAADLANEYKSCLVTGPVNKKILSCVQKDFSGHTDFLKDRFNSDEVLMYMSNGTLHLGIITTHIPLMEVPSAISKELIVKNFHLLNNGLQNIFNIANPKIAVLGLNPHAGESGQIGKEEEIIITPAINELKDSGYCAIGPISADTAFSVGGYDAILSMYHDQALPVVKTLDFNKTVNITLGLPFLRVSVDHGTAENIAHEFSANNESMLEALKISLNNYEA